MQEYKVSKKMLYAKKKGNTARKLSMYFMKKYTTMMIAEVARHVDMKAHSAGQLIRNFEKEIREKEKIRELVEKVKVKLDEE